MIHITCYRCHGTFSFGMHQAFKDGKYYHLYCMNKEPFRPEAPKEPAKVATSHKTS